MRRLTRIKPTHAELIPPLGAVAAGVTPDGKQLYTLTRKRSRPIPRMEIVPGPDGVPIERQVWRKNQMTGEPLYAVFKREDFEETILFYLESQGNNNVEIHPYVPPSAEQLAREDRTRRIAEMREGLAEALVDAGLTPAELLARVAKPTVPAVSAEPSTTTFADVPITLTDETNTVTSAPVDPTVYPLYMPPGRWKLSSGAIVKCKKDEAELMETELQLAALEARENAASAPEI